MVFCPENFSEQFAKINFSWSLTRQKRLQFCCKAAVMHCREAYFGAFADADEKLHQIYLQHCRISREEFLRRLLIKVMRESFYRGETDVENLSAFALDELEKSLQQMIFGKSKYILNDFDFPGASFNKIKRELVSTLSEKCLLLKNGAWSELLKYPAEKRRFIDTPLALQINELSCFISPLCAVSDRGKFRIVELRSGKMGDSGRITALLHRFYIYNRYGKTADMLDSLQLDLEDGLLHLLESDGSLSEILDVISDDVRNYQKLLSIPLSEIPENRINCPRCVFKNICNQ